MTAITLSLLLFLTAYFAGVLGALTGLGGGVVIIPVLVLFLHVDIHYAMGASIISVMATSSGAAIAYLREGYTNLRMGIFLETATVIGALAGALLVAAIPKGIITIIFGLVLILSSYLILTRREEAETYNRSHPLALFLKLEGNYPGLKENEVYYVQNAPLAWSIMSLAGIVSGLLGIGSGAVKVLAMDLAMRLPYKVSTATSNFIMGITAAVGAGVYFSNGYILPALTAPVMLGVIIGAISGSRIMSRVNVKTLRIIFTIVILILSVQMIAKGLSGSI